jgi:hypothetical protein
MKKYYKSGEEFVCIDESLKSYTSIHISEYTCVMINISFEEEFNRSVERLSDADLSTEEEYTQKRAEALARLSS